MAIEAVGCGETLGLTLLLGGASPGPMAVVITTRVRGIIFNTGEAIGTGTITAIRIAEPGEIPVLIALLGGSSATMMHLGSTHGTLTAPGDGIPGYETRLGLTAGCSTIPISDNPGGYLLT